MCVRASGSHTQTTHFHCRISVCVSAPGRSRSLTLGRLHRICCRWVVIMMPGTGRCSYTSITGATRWCILMIRLHLLIIIVVQVIIRVGILIEARVPVDVIRVKDWGLLGPSPGLLTPSLCPWSIPFVRVHGPVAVPGKSTALPEFVMQKDNVRVY